MRRHRLPLAVLSALALALGCSDQPAPSAPADPPAPSFRAEHFPATNVFLLGGEPSNPLAVIGGWEAGVTAEDVCEDPFEGLLLEGQKGHILLTPPGGFHEHVSATNVNLVVYAYAGGPINDRCQLVGAPVVGTGTGEFTLTFQFTSGVFITHVTVHGTIDLVGGGQARLFATARAMFQHDGTLHFDEERVSLTPQ